MGGVRIALAAVILIVMGASTMATDVDRERAAIKRTIEDSIMWPLPEKNIERLYRSVSKDSGFFIFHPSNAATIVGYDAFQEMIDNVFLSDKLKATRSEIRDLRINLSRSGDVAWFSCILDDCGEWDGQPYDWLNTRWTGVLEKRDGRWLIVQMHFSFGQDAEADSTG